MSEDPRELADPHTPPRNIIGRHGSEDGATAASPMASPSISLFSLGMSPFSPLRRQLSTHRPRLSESPRIEAGDYNKPRDLAEDSKDVLIQRLNDLVTTLSAEAEMSEGRVDSMHAKVDEMEAFFGSDGVVKSRRHKRNQSSVDSLREDPISATWLKSHLSELALPTPESHMLPLTDDASAQAEQLPRSPPLASSPKVLEVLTQARQLQAALEETVSRLKARQEEQEHIHDLLITRVERAAQRIIYLEGRIKDLESERSESEMEVLNLQIQLKAIEVQCISYVPRDADPELMQSIETWKAEWSALKHKRAHEKEDDHADSAWVSATPHDARYSPSQTMD